jgi:hypothetical protein
MSEDTNLEFESVELKDEGFTFISKIELPAIELPFTLDAPQSWCLIVSELS